MKKMMKYMPILIVILIFLAGCATMMGAKAAPELRTLVKIVEVPEQSKNELYIKVNSWFVETFNSAESVIEFQDKEAGKIMGKYTFSYSEGVYTYSMKQTVDIEMKDNKIRVKISDPYYKTTSGMGETYHNAAYNPCVTQAGVEKARKEWNKLIVSLEVSVKKDNKW